MEKELKTEEKGLSDDLTALNKKAKFLEKQYTEANAQMRDIVRSFFHLLPSPPSDGSCSPLFSSVVPSRGNEPETKTIL